MEIDHDLGGAHCIRHVQRRDVVAYALAVILFREFLEVLALSLILIRIALAQITRGSTTKFR